jgi:hypothetical protein
MFNAQQPTATFPSPSHLRAELARARVRAYCVAARLRMHPTTLSLILNGRRSLDSTLAARILTAIVREERDQTTNEQPDEKGWSRSACDVS